MYNHKKQYLMVYLKLFVRFVGKLRSALIHKIDSSPNATTEMEYLRREPCDYVEVTMRTAPSTSWNAWVLECHGKT
jgi:hypothetical protein